MNMSNSPNPTTLDLHGRRLGEAISDVTLFLERVRRTVANSNRGGLCGLTFLFVTIITGSGSHSTQGPVLRNAVQKLLEKRGMHFKLEGGGGAFHVDALSGCDLYDPGPATDSKILTSEEDEFHLLALARRGNTSGNFAQATMTQHSGTTGNIAAPSSSLRSSYNRTSSDPLPSQVASNDAEVRTAVQLSVSETQQRSNNEDRFNKEYVRQYQRAVSDSQNDHALPKRNISESEVEAEESMLKYAHDQSIVDENERQQQSSKEYEDALLLALEKSNQESLNDDEVSDDDLIQRALAESMALADAETMKYCGDDVLEKVLAESKLEEERRKSYDQAKTLEEEEEMLREVMRLSLKEEEEAVAEEEALNEAIKLSQHTC